MAYEKLMELAGYIANTNGRGQNVKHGRAAKRGGARGYTAKGIFRAFERAGLKDFRIHDLRHTCASRLIQNGMSLYEVAQMLGHVDVQTTQRYAHLENRDIGQKARDIMEKFNSV